jgi:DNA end-binding protein Ku
MAARAMWKSDLSFDGFDVPVRWYAAVESRRLGFRMLDAETMRPVQQRMVDPSTGEPVDKDAIRRGYEVDRGRYVLLRGEELAALEPEASRRVPVQTFVDADRLTAPWFDRPYWLAPDGDPEAYHALAEALRREGKVGIARWTMRKRRYVGALRAEGPYLMMSTLRHRGEVVPVDAVEAPSVSIDEREAALARQLVEALASDFDPSELREEYPERLAELLEEKARDREPATKERPAPKRETTALSDSLEQSLAQLRKEGRVA